MKKQALIGSRGLGTAITKAIRMMSFGQNSSVYHEIKLLEDSIKRIDELLGKSTLPGMREKMLATRNRYQSKLDGRINYASRLKAEHDASKQTAGTVAGIGAGLGIGGGALYLASKATEPDMGDDLKLAEDWVQGFITKCAIYNVDGRAWLNKMLDEVDKAGTIKIAAPWGKILGGILGGSALVGGADVYRRTMVGRHKGIVDAKGRADKLIAENKAEEDKMFKPQSFNNKPNYQSINEITRPTEKTPVQPVAKGVVPAAPAGNPPAGLPTGDASAIPPITVPNMTLSGKPAGRPMKPLLEPRPRIAAPIPRKTGKMFGMDEAQFMAMAPDQRHQYMASRSAEQGRQYNPGFVEAPPRMVAGKPARRTQI